MWNAWHPTGWPLATGLGQRPLGMEVDPQPQGAPDKVGLRTESQSQVQEAVTGEGHSLSGIPGVLVVKPMCSGGAGQVSLAWQQRRQAFHSQRGCSGVPGEPGGTRGDREPAPPRSPSRLIYQGPNHITTGPAPGTSDGQAEAVAGGHGDQSGHGRAADREAGDASGHTQDRHGGVLLRTSSTASCAARSPLPALRRPRGSHSSLG